MSTTTPPPVRPDESETPEREVPSTRDPAYGAALRFCGAVLLGVLIATIVFVPPEALAAANPATDVGRNLGDLLKQWAGWLFGGATAIIAVTHLGRRDIAGGLVFAGMAVLVGGFVLAGPQVADIIRGLYEIAGS